MTTAMCRDERRPSRSRFPIRRCAAVAAARRWSNRWCESTRTLLTYGSACTAASCYSRPAAPPYCGKTRRWSPTSRGRRAAADGGWTWTWRACCGRENVTVAAARPPRPWNCCCGIRRRRPERYVSATKRPTADIPFCTLSWTDRRRTVVRRVRRTSGVPAKRRDGKNERVAGAAAVADEVKNAVGRRRPVGSAGPTARSTRRRETTTGRSTAAEGTNVAGKRCASFSPTFRVSISSSSPSGSTRAFVGDGARPSTIRPPGTRSSRAFCGNSTTTTTVRVWRPAARGGPGERSVTAARRPPRQKLLSLRPNRVARPTNWTSCRSFTSMRPTRARWRWPRGKKWPSWNVRVRDSRPSDSRFDTSCTT